MADRTYYKLTLKSSGEIPMRTCLDYKTRHTDCCLINVQLSPIVQVPLWIYVGLCCFQFLIRSSLQSENNAWIGRQITVDFTPIEICQSKLQYLYQKFTSFFLINCFFFILILSLLKFFMNRTRNQAGKRTKTVWLCRGHQIMPIFTLKHVDLMQQSLRLCS